MEVLPEGWHFLPKHPEKNIKYYRHILIQEGFAKVEDIMNKGNPSIVPIISSSSQEKGSPASSEASANFDLNDPLFQDSQDPNDAYKLDSE
ncbi:hypothetical protein SO802_002765 [Lithocarpus litseifolius]|uniref:Uncharacterized protein n=1 Tax=Lithocarpus litseifolius TaxID=425828 RepID=A0AAW2E3U1_9ROSI